MRALNTKKAIIDVKGLSVIIDEKKVLQDIRMRIFQKDFAVIFGPDNSGKSVLLSVLIGLYKNYSGRVKIFGKDIECFYSNMRKHICLVPDDIIMEKGMRVEDYFQIMKIRNANYDLELEQKLCKKYNIENKEYLLDMTYQANKLVALISAMSAKRELLILDEPYNFLEEPIMVEILDDLKRLNEKGTCIIITAEKYEYLFGYGNKYMYLKNGIVMDADMITERDSCIKNVSIPKNITLTDNIGEIVCENKKTITYRYFGDLNRLLVILQKSNCQDCTIENISFEEELEAKLMKRNGE